MHSRIKIENLAKEEILKMIRACLKNEDISSAKQFLNLCHEKRRDIRGRIEDMQYLLIDKDDIEKTIKYIDALLKDKEELAI